MAGHAAAPPDGADAPADGCGSRIAAFVMRWLTALTISGCLVGIGSGLLCQVVDASLDVIKLIRFPGELFIRALKVVVIPMVFSSMVSNAAALGVTGAANRMSQLAVRYYLATTVLAALEGVALFNIFSSAFQILAVDPGHESAVEVRPAEQLNLLDAVLSFGRDLVPDNIFRCLVEMRLLGVITFGIFFGVVLAGLPRGQVVVDFFAASFEALVGMIRVIILFTPIGVASLVAGAIANGNQLGRAMANIGTLFGVVLFGQGLHVFGVYSIIYFAVTRRNPLKYLAGLSKMWITAFSTSSSAATLSTTCRTCEDLGVSRKVVNFVCPIGCTVNMDGGALELPIVVLWIAYVAAQPLPVHAQLVVALNAALLSIGNAPIPSAGVTTLILVVDAAGVKMTSSVEMLISFCLAIEWLLDSVRTAVNVTGDAIGAAVVDHLIGWQDASDAEAANAELPEEQPPAATAGGGAGAPPAPGADPGGGGGGAALRDAGRGAAAGLEEAAKPLRPGPGSAAGLCGALWRQVRGRPFAGGGP